MRHPRTLTSIFVLLGFLSLPIGVLADNNLWFLSSGNVRPNVGTWGLQLPSLTSQNCVGTNGSGVFQAGSCSNNSGTVSTSTALVNGEVDFSTGVSTIGNDGNFFWDNTNKRLGIGTSTPWAQLSVNDNGIAGPAFAIGSSTATSLVVLNSGNVGIGTTSPSSRITIAAPTSAQNVLTLDQTNLGSFDNLIRFTDNSNNQAWIGLAAPNGIVTGAAQDDLVLRSQGHNILFNTVNGGGSVQVDIQAATGNVGIGTTSPASKLTVYTTTSTSDEGNVPFTVGDTSNGGQRLYVGVNPTNHYSYIGSVQSGQVYRPLFLNPNNPSPSSNGVAIGTSTISGTAVLSVYTNTDTTNEGAPFVLGNTLTGRQFLYAGVNNASHYSYIGSVQSGTTYQPLILNPNGGSIGIGTTTPTAILDVVASNPLLSVTGQSNNDAAGLDLRHSYLASNDQIWQIKVNGSSPVTGAANRDLSIVDGSGTNYLTVKAGGSVLLQPNGGNVGVGSTSPWAQFGINPNALGSGVPEFAIGSSTATHVVVDGAGNVGIGTTTPGTKLSVQGVANFGTATSTFASSGGINLTGGCFAISGTCIGGGGASASSTTNYYSTNNSEASVMVPVVAGDVVNVWASAVCTTNCSTQDNTAKFLYRPNTFAASTTISTVDIHYGSGSNGTQGDIFQFVATTTDSIFFDLINTGFTGTTGTFKVMATKYH